MKIIKIIIIIFIYLLILTSFSSAASNETTLLTPLEQIQITSPSNIVIIIDASASTTSNDPGTGISFKSLIYHNALNIVQSVNRCDKVGIVVYGNQMNKTEIHQIKNESDRSRLLDSIWDFNKNYRIRYDKSITNLSDALSEASWMLQGIEGTNEIIVLTDGIVVKEEVDSTLETIKKIRQENIKIHFVQVLLTYMAYKNLTVPNGGIYPTFAILAKANGEEPIVLNPDEIMKVESSDSGLILDDSCSTPASTPDFKSTDIPPPAIEDTPSINKSLQTEQGENRKSWFESIIQWFKSML